jgi:thiol-disulfide isomerase/thioredoxin
MRTVSWRGFAWLMTLCSLVLTVGCTNEQPAVRMSEGVFTGHIATIDSVLAANQGKWLMVNVWATWCRPCVAETPDLVAFTKSMDGQPFAAIGISTDYFTDDDTTAVRKVSEFQTKHSIPYPNLVYLGSMDALTEHLELSGALPTTILFDPLGKPSQYFVGKLEQAQFTAIENFVR